MAETTVNGNLELPWLVAQGEPLILLDHESGLVKWAGLLVTKTG